MTIRYSATDLAKMNKAELVKHAIDLQVEVDRLLAVVRVQHTQPRLAGAPFIEPAEPGPERWRAGPQR